MIPAAVLLLTGLGFVGFGAAYALRPSRMAALTDLALPTPTSRVDFTATYGGFQLGFGAFLLACLHDAGWVPVGLWAATASLAGFAVARAAALLLARAPVRNVMRFALGLEIAGILLNAWALAQVR